jgi:hypothetical protein
MSIVFEVAVQQPDCTMHIQLQDWLAQVILEGGSKSAVILVFYGQAFCCCHLKMLDVLDD